MPCIKAMTPRITIQKAKSASYVTMGITPSLWDGGKQPPAVLVAPCEFYHIRQKKTTPAELGSAGVVSFYMTKNSAIYCLALRRQPKSHRRARGTISPRYSLRYSPMARRTAPSISSAL